MNEGFFPDEYHYLKKTNTFYLKKSEENLSFPLVFLHLLGLNVFPFNGVGRRGNKADVRACPKQVSRPTARPSVFASACLANGAKT